MPCSVICSNSVRTSTRWASDDWAVSRIARFIGSGKQKEADNTAEHTLLVILFLSALVTVVGPLFSRPLFILLGASERMLPVILSYINIILYGSFFQFYAMIGDGILRGEGNMIKPMQVMIVGTAANIILDPILIFGLGPVPALGVRGAAIATVAGRAISCLVLTASLFGRKNIVRIDLKSFRFATKIIRGIFGVGGPTIISQLSHSLGLSLLFILLRPFGDAAKTAFTMGFTYQQIAVLPLIMISGIYRGMNHRIDAKKRFDVLEYLDKPVRIEHVIDLLKEVFAGEYPAAPPEDNEARAPAEPAKDPFAGRDTTAEAKEAEKLVRSAMKKTAKSIMGRLCVTTGCTLSRVKS